MGGLSGVNFVVIVIEVAVITYVRIDLVSDDRLLAGLVPKENG